eukprot:jgi/Chlat1/1889/Chrsp145S02207
MYRVWPSRLTSRAALSCARSRLIHSLIVAEHKGGVTAQGTLCAVAAASRLAAAAGSGDDSSVSVLVAGDKDTRKVAESLSRVQHVSKVLVAEHERYAHSLAEPLSSLVLSICKAASSSSTPFTHVLAPSSTFGRNILPRAAALLDAAQVSDVLEIVDADTFIRPIYAGNALCTVRYAPSSSGPRLLTIRTTAFQPAQQDTNRAQAPIEEVSRDTETEDLPATAWVKDEMRASDRPELGSAKVVVSGGRGLKSSEGFTMLEELADCLGAALGASRAAVDAGMVPNDLQVGQTGKVVAPQLYIAVGISGAIQHLAGMKDSKVIVAINKDPEAPIFQLADYGLVGDLFKIVPEMTEKLRSLKSKQQ